ncbi:MAG TPA: hypothetical protein VFE82_18690 [Ramlibacter sp.]|jgi:hypothetical protein|uniref:hypothetical protein n=1 Tax=Ramlibacter sp. TaxID=1917967 RepID=UPI002D70ED40|nr:hypothetical protein [Ramlibacter sp.]HZY20504.1 hypothetical protein [Ramlibacter sp.]
MSVTPVAGITTINIQGMDLETALLAVQTNRANVLETQLMEQMKAVQEKNETIAKLNLALGQLSGLSAKFKSDMSATTEVRDYIKADDYQAEKPINNALKDAGLTIDTGKAGRTTDNANYWGGVNGSTTKGEIESLIQTVKSRIDAMGNTQQQDMLRLQSLSNKRNEAFDIMTNFVKKMQDSRSSILSNMR